MVYSFDIALAALNLPIRNWGNAQYNFLVLTIVLCSIGLLLLGCLVATRLARKGLQHTTMIAGAHAIFLIFGLGVLIFNLWVYGHQMDNEYKAYTYDGSEGVKHIAIIGGGASGTSAALVMMAQVRGRDRPLPPPFTLLPSLSFQR